MCVREREEKIKENGNCKGIFFLTRRVVVVMRSYVQLKTYTNTMCVSLCRYRVFLYLHTVVY